MIPLLTPDLRGNEADYLRRCVEDGWVSSAGPFVTEFERRCAELAGTAHAVATSSGTTALHLALVALGLGPGDRVAVPAWTFAATVNAVIHAGAEPVLVDVAEDSWALDPSLTEAAVAAHGAKAVIVVHPMGQPADLDPLLDLCGRHGIPLIEDAAGAVDARYKGRPVGGQGRAGMFSFNGNKMVTAGGGGMLVTDDAELAARARHLSTQARVGSRYRHDAVGFNFRMTNLNAAVGLAQLERLEEMKAAKLAHAAAYDAALAQRNDLRPAPLPAWARSNGWMYVVRCTSPAAADSLVDHLNAAGIGARHFWENLAVQAPYAGYGRQMAGMADRLGGHVVSLPSGSNMSEAERQTVITALTAWRSPA